MKVFAEGSENEKQIARNVVQWGKMKQMKKRIALAILSLHALASPAFPDEIRKISLPKDAVTIRHKVFDTDIFWEIIPWNDGSSLTVDGWGRYSVLSFDKKGRLRQETLCDFPKEQLTGGFYADRNTGFVYTRNQNIFHIYNANSKIKRSNILALIYFSDVTCGLFPLDERRMLVSHLKNDDAFSSTDDKINYGYFIYEHDEKKYERPKITDWRRISLEYQFSDDRLKFIAYDLDEKSYCVYDWQNQEKVPNKLADFLNESKLQIEMCDIKNRIIDAHSGKDDQWAHYIILWNEDFSKIEKYKLKDFFENADMVVLDSVSCDGKYGFLSCSYEDGLIDKGYWVPQKKYTWLAGFIDFEKLRAGKENPIRVTEVYGSGSSLFFATGFVPSERDGQVFIFPGEKKKANAIYMKDLF